MSTVRLTSEWAVGGKPPGSGDDYAILSCSQGQLDHNAFEDIRTRYAIGTPAELPQVTIAWVGAEENARLILAIQDWSGEEDRRRRGIARTAYFCVPYDQVARSPVSYEALYRAFSGCRLPAAGPLVVPVPRLDPGALAAAVQETVMGVAALLMTDQHVCVVEGGAVPTSTRLRFLDTVAALLPYGMRTRLTASTWASSTAEHKIKLSFTEHVPPGAYAVAWGRAAEIPAHEDAAHAYLGLLRHHRPDAALVDWLATRTEQLSFNENGRSRALDLLREFGSSGGTAAGLSAAGQDQVERLLVECAEALDHGSPDDLENTLFRLDNATSRRGTTLSEEERSRCQKLIEERGLLLKDRALSTSLEAHLYETLVLAGYGSTVTYGEMRRILQEVPAPSRALMTAIMHRPVPDLAVSITMADRLGHAALERQLESWSARQLVEVAARQPHDPRTVKIACDEIVKRGEDGAEAAEIAQALHEHGYLVEAVSALHPAAGARFTRLRHLLWAAYGPEPQPRDFERVFYSPAGRSPALIAAAVCLYGPDAGDALTSSVVSFLRGAELDAQTFDHVKRLLVESRTGNRLRQLTSAEPARTGLRRLGRRRSQGARHLEDGQGNGFIPYLVIAVLSVIAVVQLILLAVMVSW